MCVDSADGRGHSSVLALLGSTYFFECREVILVREVELVPDYLVEGLVSSSSKENKRKSKGKLADSVAVWQRVNIGGVDYIVRSARRLSVEVVDV